MGGSAAQMASMACESPSKWSRSRSCWRVGGVLAEADGDEVGGACGDNDGGLAVGAGEVAMFDGEIEAAAVDVDAVGGVLVGRCHSRPAYRLKGPQRVLPA